MNLVGTFSPLAEWLLGAFTGNALVWMGLGWLDRARARRRRRQATKPRCRVAQGGWIYNLPDQPRPDPTRRAMSTCCSKAATEASRTKCRVGTRAGGAAPPRTGDGTLWPIGSRPAHDRPASTWPRWRLACHELPRSIHRRGARLICASGACHASVRRLGSSAMIGALFASALLVAVALHGPLTRAALAAERIARALEPLAALAERGRR